MPQGRIQLRTWFVEFGFVEFGLAVSAAPAFAADRSELELPTAVPPSDSEIRMCIKDMMDTSSQSGRRIRSLQHVSFAYKSTGTDSGDTPQDLACNPANVVDVVGFVHGSKSILDTTMRSWIEDPRVIDQQWTPASIQQGTCGNWRQHDIILAFFSNYECGCRVRVDWSARGCRVRVDPSAPVAMGGSKKRPPIATPRG